jgi:hypothetical protein
MHDIGEPIRELDHRTNNGITVTLLWNAQTNRLFISVLDMPDGPSLEFDVAPADALDACHHPYSYAKDNQHDGALAA